MNLNVRDLLALSDLRSSDLMSIIERAQDMAGFWSQRRMVQSRSMRVGLSSPSRLGCSSYASTSAHSCSKNGEVRRYAEPRQFPIYGRLVEPTLRKLGVAPLPRRQHEFGARFAAKLT
jgi:hypothetical protein